jgi:putative transposase
MNIFPPTEEELDEWDEPELNGRTPQIIAAYNKRKAALRSVVRGNSMLAAAKANGVQRNTLIKMVNTCAAMAPDGKPWGWRVCLPHRVRVPSAKQTSPVPAKSGPGAFGRLLRALPGVAPMLADFHKPLPTRERRSTAFERLFEKFLAAVRKHTLGVGYPFNAGDKGRRALLEHLKRIRQDLPQSECEEEYTDVTQAKQLKEVFDFGMMERLEFDAHRMDADFCLEVEDGSGKTVLREISYVWLLLIIDAASRLVLGWSLVVGRGYSQIDVLRLFNRALTPWVPRDLLAPEMKYVPESGVGTVVATGRLLRGVLSAIDNAMAHHAKLTTTNATRHMRGVLHLGPAHVPETRGVLEALFRQMENGAIRHLPGGFEPARGADTPKRATTADSAEQHPLNPVALHDLMDVVIAGYNATPLTALGEQSALAVVRRFVSGGGWTFESSRTPADASNLALLRLTVTIKGNRKEGRQPYVNYRRARYRAFGLRDRWDWVGQEVQAVISMEDLRYITLLTVKGDVLVRLTALPPWSRTRHDFDMRKLIIRWSNRGLFSIVGVDDAISAYRTFVRTHAHQLPAAVDQLAKHSSCTPLAPTSQTQAPVVFAPRGGRVSFDHSKDPTK